MPLLLLVMLCFAAVSMPAGYLVLRAAGLPRGWSVCGSALAGIATVNIIGFVYSFLGVISTPLTVLAPAIVLPAVVVVVRMLCRRTTREHHTIADIPLLHMLGYLAAGCVGVYFFFVGRLPWENYLIQVSDMPFHINLIQSMAESGRFSSLHVGAYLAPEDALINPLPGGGFYPAGWHVLCALVMQITHADGGVILNGANAFFIAWVYPLAMCALITSIFPTSPRAQLIGTLTCISFVAFPWILLIFGGIYPNLAGFCTISFPMALFVLFFSNKLQVKESISLVVCFLISVIGQVLLHPNTIFTAIVILVPFVTHVLWAELHVERKVRLLVTFAAIVAFLLFVAVVWLGFYSMPAFKGLFEFTRAPFAKPFQELFNIVGLSYAFMGSFDYAFQIPLAIFVIIGAVRALYSSKTRWLPFSYAICCAIMFMGAVTGSKLRKLICGVWYTDPNRLAAMAVLAAIPLAVLGIEWVFEMILERVEHYNKARNHTTHVWAVVTACTLLYAFITFGNNLRTPGSFHTENDVIENSNILNSSSEIQEYVVGMQEEPNIHLPFGDFRDHFDETCSQNVPLALNEQEFLDKVKAVVGPDDLVINVPIDGSYFAYGYTGLRLYYREIGGYRDLSLGPAEAKEAFSETDESVLIRTSLSSIAANSQVKEAVESIGARYVLVLSTTNSEESFIGGRGGFHPWDFVGISSITHETPGFTLVLSQGDLALYRIDGE
jgi:hypothetical protein